jgi:hypothetical protein
MALIIALPEEYGSFVSTLLMKDKLDKPTIHQAFITEEMARHCRAADHLAMAASTARASCEFCVRIGSTRH